MSRASDIASVLAGRLAGVTVENGYLSDIGLRVFRGKRKISEQDVPCVVLVENDDKPDEQEDSEVRISQAYALEAHDRCDPDNPNDRAHELIADLKRSIFSGDLRLGGLSSKTRYAGRTIAPREEGMQLVAAAIFIEVDYSEDLASP